MATAVLGAAAGSGAGSGVSTTASDCAAAAGADGVVSMSGLRWDWAFGAAVGRAVRVWGEWSDPAGVSCDGAVPVWDCFRRWILVVAVRGVALEPVAPESSGSSVEAEFEFLVVVVSASSSVVLRVRVEPVVVGRFDLALLWVALTDFFVAVDPELGAPALDFVCVESSADATPAALAADATSPMPTAPTRSQCA
ncbi:hypothetical protein FR943_16850 [Mycobacterium sp. TNTM28]|uniref:Secreted protein n=1 Tax=[Mycobacterium] fortunisiensis TaxID=2600579 RepID=A0ABS6KPG9_9MYCO|nr:hypothetical protein [[Mycobacterium] fortunisiensis]MBU9765509.1 hypothetical protein [[Mycobacterium] fortunisiensis]